MSLVARVAILELIMAMVKIKKHSGQRISLRMNGKHAALSWKNRRDCIPHSPLSPHLRKTTGRAGPWQLMAANVGNMYVVGIRWNLTFHEMPRHSVACRQCLKYSQKYASYNKCLKILGISWNARQRPSKYCNLAKIVRIQQLPRHYM